MTPSKIAEGLLYAGFMQLFFNGKKKNGGDLPLRRFSDWVATEDERRLTFSFEACLDFFNTESV